MIIDRFDDQVKKNPHLVAIKTANSELTYQELNDYANAVALEVIDKHGELGISNRETAALLFEHGSDMIVGKFGLLKAEKIFVPLDPAYPHQLLEYMLANSEANIIITNDENIELAKVLIQGSNSNAEIINISKIKRTDLQEFANPKCGGEEVAYILYTSGSTGKPKGVMQSHRGVLHFAECYRNAVSITSEDRMTLLSSFCHDAGIGDIYAALLNGASLYPLDVKSNITMNEIASWLKAERISIWYSVPTLYRYFINSINEDDVFTSLRFIILGGESVLLHDVNMYQKHFSSTNTKFAIMYGQTESSINSMQIYTADSEIEEITLGEPVYETEIVVLNENRQEVAPLRTGEIVILSDHVALGYWKDEEKSNDAFREIPEVGRTYSTGDLGKLLLDGNIEFVGRKDFQVKIRGFRVEMSGIENQLLKLDGVKEAVVTAYIDDSREKYLCAYVVLDEDTKLSELRYHLSESLPDYMIPSFFIKMEELPITPTGKVNRKALPAPTSDIDSKYVEPRNQREEVLVGIWSEVLNKEKISIYDDFFELGGHSLRGVILISKIHKELNVEIPFRELFRLSTIAKLSEYISEAKESVYASIGTAEEKEYYETSSAQKRMWLLQQFDHESTGYNMPGVLILDGELDKERLELAFLGLIRRHEMLRTSFYMIEELVQRISVEVDFGIVYSEVLEENIDVVIKDFVRPFELSKAPLLRASLVKVTGNRHYLLFDMHHIISDGVSMGILMKDIVALYDGQKLKEQRIQYKDFSEWQNGFLKSEKMQEQEIYWLDQFSNEVPLLDLPLDYMRPILQSFEGGVVEFKLDQGITEQLNSLAQEVGATLYMVLLSAVSILLSKYTHQEDIIIGSPVAGRTHVDLEAIIGMFVNTLVMRTYPLGNKTYTEFLKEVKEIALTAYENQDYQFEELVERLNLRRDLSRNPLFDVMFVLQNMESIHLEVDELQFTSYPNTQPIAKFDLTFIAVEMEGGISFGVEYCTKLFKYETIKRMTCHLQSVLTAITSDRTIKIQAIDILSQREHHQLMYEFNDTCIEYPKNKTIHQLFENQVIETPDNVALVFNEESMTYSELNTKANQLARILRVNGVKSDGIVGIMMERSLDMIIGILGVLKSGGAYLPIDPDFPEERIKFLLEDSKVEKILTQSWLNEKIDFDVEKINLNKTGVYEGEDSNLEIASCTNDLAYVTYTSGSTGKPKGVMIEHRSVVNLAVGQKNRYMIDENDRLLQFYSISFDPFVEQMFVVLLSGASLYLVDTTILLDVSQFMVFLQNNSITHLDVVPSFLDELNLSELHHLKRVVSGGEACSLNLAKRLSSKFDFYNGYGPTEATVTATMCRVNSENINLTVPIGKPLANYQVYILTSDSNLTPIGIPGELCISGDGLARGYLNRPELTAEKFVENPFIKGERIYCTGDLARWLPDGNIEFLGRIDHQVKIRGFRVELGEIERCLLELDAAKEVVVTAKVDKTGDKYLCAYMVTDVEISLGDIQKSLSEILPEYMIPSHFVRLSEMPLTPNGKIDRNALPEPDILSSRLEYTAPRNKMEKTMVEIWSEILGRDGVGIYDNFFELGGHSLRVTRLVNRIESETGVRIAIKDVFLNPTVKALVDFVLESETIQYLPIPTAEKKEYYEMSLAQKRIYLIQQRDPEAVTYNMPLYLKLKGEMCPELIENTLQKLIDRHEILRTAFIMVEGVLVQRIQERVVVDFDYEREVQDDDKKWMLEFMKPFDLSKASQLRTKVVNMGNYCLLMFDMHHIISDGMSMSNFIHEFITLYNKKALEELTHQFKDYSEWMRNRDLSSQREYWEGEFVDEIPVLDLPLDYVRPKEQSFEGALVGIGIDKELGGKIKALARKTESTEYMIFLAAAMVLLGTYANQEDVVIGSSISGRTHKDTEYMLGMFVNTLAMRGRPEKEKSFKHLLEEVKISSLKAYENQEYPIEELMEIADVRRDLSRNPLFDVMLILQNNEKSAVAIDGISAEYTGVDSQIAKFDLTFNIWEVRENYGITLEYCTALFKKESMELMLKHYAELLRNLMESPDLMLKEISMTTEEEKRQILEEFNDTYVDYPKENTVIQMFEKQARKTPNNVAVVFQNEQVTYKELNEKANTVAYHLRELGVAPDVIVGVVMEKSIEMIIGILGILKSGGAYMPIDSDFPIERVRYMLEDSEARIVLSTNTLIDNLKLQNYLKDIEIIDLNSDEIENSEPNLASITTLMNLAYVMYTSGSTGGPKGVMVEHKNVINYIYAYIEITRLTNQDCFLQQSNFTFDIFVEEVFPILSLGGKLVMITKNQILDQSYLSDLIIKHHVTALSTTPQILKLLNGHHENLDIKSYTCGGDVLRYEDIDKLVSNSTIYNSYGPTECTIATSFYKYELSDKYKTIPIGKPIPNMQIYIINGDILCGIGMPGELCVAGAGVARGYLNRPELTQQNFQNNPYGRGKLYRTGDLARWLPDGNIEYLGRLDEQVKIRGFRIDLGEIENAIRELSEINDCAVIAREHTLCYEDKEIAINVYLVSEVELEMSQIRGNLEKTLPAYMIPTYMMQIDSIPVTRNGKLDKRALPEIEARTEIEYAPSRNATEEKLVQIWSEVLGVKRVGVYDNFFELGGDSLKSITLVFRARQQGVELSIQDVFDKPSIALQADHTIKSDYHMVKYRMEDFKSLHKLLESNTISKQAIPIKQTLGDVLITGTTGWLGAHVLDKFLSYETGIAYCLVRGEDLVASQNKLNEMLSYYFGEKYVRCSRIIVVCGDIVDKITLEASIDTVFHCAASVKHYGTYADFYDINVQGTQNAITFTKEKSAQLIHISTISVVGGHIPKLGNNSSLIIYDETKLFVGQVLGDVYARSKFEAEILVLQAKLEGLDAMVVRVGNLTNRSNDLKFQKNYQENAFLKILKGFVDLGLYSKESESFGVEFSPVDYTAEAIIKLAQYFNHDYSIFHVFNPKLTQLIDFVDALGAVGRKVEAVPHEELLKKIENAMHIPGKERTEPSASEHCEVVPFSIENDFTCTYLQEIGFKWGEINDAYLQAYLQYFNQLGYWESLRSEELFKTPAS